MRTFLVVLLVSFSLSAFATAPQPQQTPQSSANNSWAQGNPYNILQVEIANLRSAVEAFSRSTFRQLPSSAFQGRMMQFARIAFILNQRLGPSSPTPQSYSTDALRQRIIAIQFLLRAIYLAYYSH